MGRLDRSADALFRKLERIDWIGRAPRRVLDGPADYARGAGLQDGLRNDLGTVAEAILEIGLDGEIDCSGNQACVAEHELPRREADGIWQATSGHRAKARRVDQRHADMGEQAGGAHVPTGGGQSGLGTSVERTAKLGLLLRAPHQRRSSGSCEMLSCARTRWPARDRASGCFLTSPLLGIHSSIYAGRSWGMRHRLPHAWGA